MSISKSNTVKAVEKWLNTFVVDLNLCPFARPVMHSGAVRFVVEPGDMEASLQAVARECEFLQHELQWETSLIILESRLIDFDTYLGLIEAANELLDVLGYAGIFQVASFHPEYQFADSAVDDVENYTNRSPFPILQLLRESSVSRAVDGYADMDVIPERNMQTMRDLGLVEVRKRLSQCFD